MCRFCLFLLSYRMGGGFTRSVAEGHGLSDCFFTRSVAESHGFFFLSRIVGFFFFNHTENRGRSRGVFFSRIIEFFFTRNDAEGHELSNYRIFFTRSVAEGHGFFLSRIIELSNFLHTENRGRSRIFLHTECWECGGVGDEEGWVLVFVCDS